jgi:hypothetical protein
VLTHHKSSDWVNVRRCIQINIVTCEMNIVQYKVNMFENLPKVQKTKQDQLFSMKYRKRFICYIKQPLLSLLLAVYVPHLAKCVSASLSHHQWLCIYVFGSVYKIKEYISGQE